MQYENVGGMADCGQLKGGESGGAEQMDPKKISRKASNSVVHFGAENQPFS
jgi:hypothetical protein